MESLCCSQARRGFEKSIEFDHVSLPLAIAKQMDLALRVTRE
jgi:hypothetical protein